MGEIALSGSALGSSLQQLLMADEIIPGSDISYQLCKLIYLYHPLGAKMAEAPIAMAQSQSRKISVPDGPEERVTKRFQDEWKALGADRHIMTTMVTARIYGIASVVYGSVDVPTEKPIDPMSLAKLPLYFNVLDPLNTSGSLVLNQEPNSPDFQKVTTVSVQGSAYHRSRAVVILNESPIYIAYTDSAFGYVGRSAYQRALFPLKSFINSMIADDMVSRKVGVLIAKLKAPGSIIDNLMANMAGIKRQLLQQAKTDNVLSIDTEETVESLNLQNIDGAHTAARKNIIENIATASGMPAKLLLQESFAEGFGEGTEDAKYIAQFIDRIRVEMQPLYAFFDRIVQHRAWSKDFYETIQAEFPEYKKIGYEQAFYNWQNSFEAEWPSLISEPDSEKIKVDDTRLKAVISMIEVMMPNMDPNNKAILLQWAADNFNENKMLFSTPLELDWEALKNYTPPGEGSSEVPPGDNGKEPKAPAPEKLSRAA